MRVLIAGLLLVSGLHAAGVDGTVVNASTGKPQAGATVSLFQVTKDGPQMVDSVKSDAEGKFAFAKEFQGPRLVQAAYAGVTYNKMIPPGMPSNGVSLAVYESSKKPGQARVDQHMMLLEPTPEGALRVSESYVFKNEGTATWNDPDAGTLQFMLPEGAGGKVEINATAPGSVPVRKAADPGPKPGMYKLDFPIKPGDSRVDLTWSMPFKSPGVFEGKELFKGGQTRIVAPKGVIIKGDGVQNLGTEPQSQATIYGIKGPVYKVSVEGVGLLKQDAPAESGEDNGAPRLTENLPKIYGLMSSTAGLLDTANSVKWFLITVLGMLACAFVLLYRKGNPNEDAVPLQAKAKNDRGKR